MGRYGRNAMVQGAAAELFKVWAVTVRAPAAALDARIVLCLHDELLVHAPIEHGDAVARPGRRRACGEAAHRWAPGRPVRFVADISVITAGPTPRTDLGTAPGVSRNRPRPPVR